MANVILVDLVGMLVGIALESISQTEVSTPLEISIVASSPPANLTSCVLFAIKYHSIIIAISADGMFGFLFEAFTFTLSNMTQRT